MHGAGSPLKGRPGGYSIKNRMSMMLKYLPAKLRSQYEASLENPDFLALRESIAILETRLADLLTRADMGAGRDLWVKAQAALRLMDEAARQKDDQAYKDANRELHRLLAVGVADYVLWDDITGNLANTARLREIEIKRLEKMTQVVQREQVIGLLVRLTGIIDKQVPSIEARSAILHDIRLLMMEVG